ncbi:hypothetical protein [Schleiferilactobacillus shenzhenensis]|uniref:DUF669 domain-containing protein n=1 Tax=Schleiferilactobacillus shenzhenensis LY-73 TaxID=1231336 RepID=U4TR81_9LACO|nr:hypothetical protein [Schleiferilactobacillus shenzhenensis]ERL64017.1 hypothetical protein L248_1664 [Schleiferilactobacillus shenzhenensis LY-73]
MSLFDKAQEVLSGFDATKDSANSFEGLPSGTYTVIVNTIDHHVTPSGWDGLRIITEVNAGEHVGTKDFNMFNLDETTSTGKKVPDSVISSHIKLIAKLANACGITLKPEDWEDIDHLVTAFNFGGAIGKIVTMDLTVRENKKNPQYPYKNYDFEPAEQPVQPNVSDEDMPSNLSDMPDKKPAAGGDPIDIDDDDLPF